MKRLFALLIFLTACHLTPRDAATVAANETHDVAMVEYHQITGYCVPLYEAAHTKADIEAADKVCIPASAAYSATKAAWETLIAVITASKLGQATDADIDTAARALGQAYIDLAKVVSTMHSGGSK